MNKLQINILILSLVFGLLLSQSVFASDDSIWCDNLEVTNCSNEYNLYVCSYDGDDSVRVVAVEDKKVSQGSTVSFKCNHKNCDLRAALKYSSEFADSCTTYNSNVSGYNARNDKTFDINSCGSYYIYASYDSANGLDWNSRTSTCP